MWWRVFIPSWRFFDQLGAVPELFVKTDCQWTSLTRPFYNSWRSYFCNPVGNLQHARDNLMERLLIEAQTESEISTLNSYQLVVQIVRDALHDLPTGTRFQFKITARGEDALLSPESEL